MATTTIYDKTAKGLEEIQTRKFQLASRLRSLLVLVDGKATEDMLLKKVAGLGLTIENLSELLHQGFIAPHANVAAAVAASIPHNETRPVKPAIQPAPSQGIPAQATTPAVLAEGESLYQALYNFYTSGIKANLGLRGYAMQLKVERCGSIDDFKELRQTFLEAVQKSKGQDVANGLTTRLDQLLALP